MQCTRCGSLESNDSAFCGTCGSALPGDWQQPRAAQLEGARSRAFGSPAAEPARGRGGSGLIIGLTVGVIVLLLAVGAVLVLSAGGSTEDISGAGDGGEQVDESADDGESSGDPETPNSTVPASPGELLALAGAEWQAVVDSLSADASVTTVESVLDVPTAAVVDGVGQPIQIWEFAAGAGWASVLTIPIEWGFGAGTPDGFRMADVTNDGSAELLFSYYPGNDSVGVFYQRQPSGAWDVILEDRALDALPDGSVVSYIETCVPDCASGPQIEVRHVWNGMSFDSQTYDGFGNPVDIYIRTGCVGDYNPRDYAPLRKCDKGLAVEQLQAALLYYGFLITSDAEPPAVDGYFGKDTDTSVRIYQLAIGVPVTGVADGQWYYDLIENYNLSTGNY